MKKFFIILTLITIESPFAQETDITSALKEIETGNIVNAEKILNELKSTNPNDPSVLFLDAVLTKDGNSSLKKYMLIYEKFPNCKYADASLYRIFSYYYSLGLYKKAEKYLTKLKEEYPNSHYLQAADRTIPDEDDSSIFNAEQISTQKVNKTDTEKIPKITYTVQAGAFLNLDNAQRLSTQLTDLGYSTEITAKEIGGTTLNIVTVGKFDSEAKASSMLDFLKQKFNLNGRIIQTTNQ
ncbi:SPOR domain-containing protein [Melioribacteraceae bacterium 4301-Me]|uniref:SPOR domain-containing protein n=1 Tax=Pyranulibacter aquaticus TaxID=3163344 RepID=UPI0035977D7C